MNRFVLGIVSVSALAALASACAPSLGAQSRYATDPREAIADDGRFAVASDVRARDSRAETANANQAISRDRPVATSTDRGPFVAGSHPIR
jgi:hypothetical protein